MPACLLMLLISGCEMTGRVHKLEEDKAQVIVDNSCKLFRPILIAKADKLDPDTAAQILVHNETGRRACGWEPTGKK